MIPSLEKRHAPGGILCPCFGGSSSSASNQTTNTTTNNTDKRTVADGSASVASVDGSHNVVNITDNGAVGMALNANAHNTDTLLATAEHLLGNQQKIQDSNLALVGQLNNSAMAAYADASSQASGNKPLILAGIVVMGVVAFHSFGKH